MISLGTVNFEECIRNVHVGDGKLEVDTLTVFAFATNDNSRVVDDANVIQRLFEVLVVVHCHVGVIPNAATVADLKLILLVAELCD